MTYYIYDNTGRITYAYSEQPVLLDGQNVLESEVDLLKTGPYYVDNGVLVEMPKPPSSNSTFDYVTKQWVDNRTVESQWVVVRADRNQRLASSDWTQLADIPQTTKNLWEPYRQALRDVTLQPDPFNITWPTPPQ